ncbi:MAG: ABC transporter ATP-binding protein [Chloroflexi bacterium]|nr:ABC transporter ATP-binding protein [Chloroflexota bacterium]
MLLRPLPVIGLALAVIALPLFLNTYQTAVLAYVGLYVMLGVGLNVVVGFAGLLDLGYVAFFAVGAYLYALAASPHFGVHISFWWMVPLAMLVAALAGILLGLPVLRMRGDYLAIVTLGFGEIIRLLLNNLDSLTRGPQGILGIDVPVLFSFHVRVPGLVDFAPPAIPGVVANLRITPAYYYYFALAGCALAIFCAQRLKDSRLGRAWEAIREDEEAAIAMGIDPIRAKLLAFAIGAAVGGLGGVLFAAAQGSIFPSDFGLMVSINVLALVIIGGMGSIPGVVVGAVILVGVPELLRSLAEYRLLIFGALLVAVMVLRPAGIWPASRRRAEFASDPEGV